MPLLRLCRLDEFRGQYTYGHMSWRSNLERKTRMGLQHGSAHRNVPAGCGHVEGSYMGSVHKQLDLGVGPVVGALALVGKAGPVLEQHHGDVQVPVQGCVVQRSVALVGIHVNEPG